MKEGRRESPKLVPSPKWVNRRIRQQRVQIVDLVAKAGELIARRQFLPLAAAGGFPISCEPSAIPDSKIWAVWGVPEGRGSYRAVLRTFRHRVANENLVARLLRLGWATSNDHTMLVAGNIRLVAGNILTTYRPQTSR